jgi:hypothetical protein
LAADGAALAALISFHAQTFGPVADPARGMNDESHSLDPGVVPAPGNRDDAALRALLSRWSFTHVQHGPGSLASIELFASTKTITRLLQLREGLDVLGFVPVIAEAETHGVVVPPAGRVTPLDARLPASPLVVVVRARVLDLRVGEGSRT